MCLQIYLLVADQLDYTKLTQVKCIEPCLYSIYSKLLLVSGSAQLDDPDGPSQTSAFNLWGR